MKMFFGRRLAAVFLAVLLSMVFAGCGGGGGSDAVVSAPGTPPVVSDSPPEEGQNKTPPSDEVGSNEDGSVAEENVQIEKEVFDSLPQEQKEEWEKLAEKSSTPLVASLDDTTKIPTFISGSIKIDTKIDDESTKQEATQVLETFEGVLTAGKVNETFIFTGISESDENITHVRFQEHISNLRVFGADVVVHLQDGNIISSFNGRYVPFQSLNAVDLTPALSLERAVSLAGEAFAVSGEEVINISVEGEEVDQIPEGELLIYDKSLLTGGDSSPRLCWYVDLKNGFEFLIDAKTGDVLDYFTKIHSALIRWTLNMNNTTTTPTFELTNAGCILNTGCDPEAITAHNSVSTVYDYYRNHFARDNYNDNPTAITRSFVHFGTNWRNASWMGAGIAYGDGFVNSLDVVGHEFTHGVTQSSSNLVYARESGALNESYSDVFGSMLDNNWLIGEGLPAGVQRSLANPLQFGNPDHVNIIDQSVNDTTCTGGASGNDFCGVHTNSGIPNKAAYLIVDGGDNQGANQNINIRGIGRAKAEQLFYETLVNRLNQTSRFGDAADLTRQTCLEFARRGRFGLTNNDCYQVHNAYVAVGMAESTICARNSDPNQRDSNNNDIGNGCEPDFDDDGIDNESDNCPNIANSDQSDVDGDEIGDVCDANPTVPLMASILPILNMLMD